MRKLKVYGWQSWDILPTFKQKPGRYTTRCICAASSRRELAEIAGEKGPWKLFNLSETGNVEEIEFALDHPRAVFAQPIDTIGKDRARWEPVKARAP